MWSKFSGVRTFFSPNLNLVNSRISVRVSNIDNQLRFYKSFRSSAWRWRWVSKSSESQGRNQTDFNNLFNLTPGGSGITYNTDINWTDSSGKPNYLPSNNFGWEVTAYLRIDKPGEYQFNTRSDDSNQLEINGSIVTSFYGGRALNVGENSDVIFLNVGNHLFRYRMEQGDGASAAQVRWKVPNSNEFVVIPAINFMTN